MLSRFGKGPRAKGGILEVLKNTFWGEVVEGNSWVWDAFERLIFFVVSGEWKVRCRRYFGDKVLSITPESFFNREELGADKIVFINYKWVNILSTNF